MNRTLLKILSVRPDLSDYVFHFTSGPNASDTLEKIISDKRLRDVKGKGVICFTEAPLFALPDMFDIFLDFDSPLYSPYGIALPKKMLFELGGRSVIYGPLNEINLIDQSIRWRYVEYDSERDFSWLREWRIASSHLELDPDHCFIITKEEYELSYLTHEEGEICVDVERNDGGWEPSYSMEMKRSWKSISLDEVREKKSHLDIQKAIENQCIGCIDFYGYLGSGPTIAP